MAFNREEWLKRYSADRLMACESIFSHRHTQDTPPFHGAMIELWQAQDEFVLIEAFREGAKSTRAEEFLLLEALFGNFPYALIIGETYKKACERLAAIQYEALHNTKIAQLWGRVDGKPWNENEATFFNLTKLQAVGWDQEIRGFKWLDHRPWRAFLDDVENKEMVASEERVKASMDKLYLEVLPALDKVNRKVRVTGTPLAADTMVTRLRANPDWVCRQFPICDGPVDDENTVALWPGRYPMEWIRKERQTYINAGKLAQFNQEYLLSPEHAENKAFSEDQLRFDPPTITSWTPRWATFDPARTVGPRSAQTGMAVFSWVGPRLVVWESASEFWQPDEIINKLFAVDQSHRPVAIGVERNSLDDWLMQPVHSEMVRRGISLPIVPLLAPQGERKADFIKGLQPFFKAREVVFVGNREHHEALIAQILAFPEGRQDGFNALAYALKIRPGDPVYNDFTEEHIEEDLKSVFELPLLLAFNASNEWTTCVIVQVEGNSMRVFAEFVSPGNVSDFIDRVLTAVRLTWPRQKTIAWAPADLHDNWTRTPLVKELRAQGVSPFRAELIAESRSSLSTYLRMQMNRKPCLLVDSSCRHLINGFFGGYAIPVKSSGVATGEPVRNMYRTLLEGLECLTAFAGGRISDPTAGAHFAHNAQGIRYMTTIPR